MKGDLLVETQCDFQPLTLPGTCGVSIPANERGIPLANIQALYGDSTERVFSESARKRRFRRRAAPATLVYGALLTSSSPLPGRYFRWVDSG